MWLRSVNLAPVALRKTAERLSRNPNREGLTGTVQDNVLRPAAERLGKDTLRTIAPPSNISKALDPEGEGVNIIILKCRQQGYCTG